MSEGLRANASAQGCSTWYGGLLAKQFSLKGDADLETEASEITVPKSESHVSLPSNFWMILPPLASSLLLAPGLRKFRTAPVMASASGLFWRVRLPALVPGSFLCKPFIGLGLWPVLGIILFNHCRFTSKAQGVQTLQNDFKNVIVKGHPDWKNLHKNCPPHKTDTLPGALLPRYCHDRCFLLPPPTQPSLGGLWLEVLEVTGRTSAFFW